MGGEVAEIGGIILLVILLVVCYVRMVERLMYAVCVKTSYRKKIGTNGKVWVKNGYCEFYVSKKERGLWKTKEEANRARTEPWEIIVEAEQ